MTHQMTIIDAAWKRLAATAPGAIQMVDTKVPKLYLNVERNPSTAQIEQSFIYYTSSRVSSFTATYTNIIIIDTKDNANNYYIQVTLLNQHLYDLFLIMVGDILYQVGKASAPEQEGVFKSQLDSWLHFINKTPNEILSKKEQVGLYGELSFIKKLLDAGAKQDYVIEGWNGSDGEDKDFQYSGYGVEVKSSMQQNHIIHISNIRQLDDTGYKALFLQYNSYSKVDGGLNTLPQLVADIRNQLNGIALDSFDRALLHRRYFSKDEANYTDGYTPIYEETYAVNNTFPRIIPNNVMIGVLDAKYEIDLNIKYNGNSSNSGIGKITNKIPLNDIDKEDVKSEIAENVRSEDMEEFDLITLIVWLSQNGY